MLSDAEFLSSVNGFADVLIKLDALCRKTVRAPQLSCSWKRLLAAAERKRKPGWRNWEERRKAKAQCRRCDLPSVNGRHCQRHLTDERTKNRNRYRRKHGIPFNAPVTPRRPRLIYQRRGSRRVARQEDRSAHYAFLTTRVVRVMYVQTRTGPRQRNVLMPIVHVGAQLIALGLSRKQLWPAKKAQQRNHGRVCQSFWNRHTDHELLEILELARKGWIQKQQQAYPRVEWEADEESKLLNILFQNVERLFRNHGIVLNA